MYMQACVQEQHRLTAAHPSAAATTSCHYYYYYYWAPMGSPCGGVLHGGRFALSGWSSWSWHSWSGGTALAAEALHFFWIVGPIVPPISHPDSSEKKNGHLGRPATACIHYHRAIENDPEHRSAEALAEYCEQ